MPPQDTASPAPSSRTALGQVTLEVNAKSAVWAKVKGHRDPCKLSCYKGSRLGYRWVLLKPSGKMAGRAVRFFGCQQSTASAALAAWVDRHGEELLSKAEARRITALSKNPAAFTTTASGQATAPGQDTGQAPASGQATAVGQDSASEHLLLMAMLVHTGLTAKYQANMLAAADVQAFSTCVDVLGGLHGAEHVALILHQLHLPTHMCTFTRHLSSTVFGQGGNPAAPTTAWSQDPAAFTAERLRYCLLLADAEIAGNADLALRSRQEARLLLTGLYAHWCSLRAFTGPKDLLSKWLGAQDALQQVVAAMSAMRTASGDGTLSKCQAAASRLYGIGDSYLSAHLVRTWAAHAASGQGTAFGQGTPLGQGTASGQAAVVTVTAQATASGHAAGATASDQVVTVTAQATASGHAAGATASNQATASGQALGATASNQVTASCQASLHDDWGFFGTPPALERGERNGRRVRGEGG